VVEKIPMPKAPAEDRRDALAELLALVSSVEDADDAIQRGLEYTAAAIGAEFGAIVRQGTVLASRGFRAADVPILALVDIAEGRADVLDYGGFRSCECAAVPIEDETDARLVLTRIDRRFTDDDKQQLRAMGRVLTLAVRMLRRQELLERLSRIQRSIVHRAALQDVLDGIVGGASELLGDEIAVLRLVEPHNDSQMVLAAATGVPNDLMEAVRRGPIGEGVGGLAVARNALVVEEAYSSWEGGIQAYRDRGLQAAMAAPVHENGVPVGSLTVASFRPGRRYTQAEQEVLSAFAEHGSLALTDARNFEDAMHQAFHDSLTGLPNRALFLDRLELAHARARRSGSPIAVLFMDLDSFKNVNDSLGHAAGDELLVLVASRLRRWVRPSDTAARFGGDEFAILLEDLDTSNAAQLVARRILDSLREPFEIQGQEVFVGASVGIASSAHPGSDDLLRNADLAMYRAKGLGKARFQTFEPGMHVAVLERLELEVDLQRALDRAEMSVHYQPIVELANQKIVALEALVRWRHPVRGMIHPAEFIALAEETGQIHRLGQWVLEQAARDACAWNAALRADSPVRIDVNLSGRQLQEATLVGQIAAVLADTGLPAHLLVLEITETVLMQDLEGTVAKLQELRRLGLRLSVDDFGTGYSSLQYLRRFPLDSLKIAKSFVDGVGGPAQDAAVARAIIELGTSFQLNVVAEGIEKPEQHAHLVDLGCTHGQGFLYARPVPADQVEPLLAAERLAWRS
jgi:diguanylate cyclase (GGDEF)-like protein